MTRVRSRAGSHPTASDPPRVKSGMTPPVGLCGPVVPVFVPGMQHHGPNKMAEGQLIPGKSDHGDSRRPPIGPGGHVMLRPYGEPDAGAESDFGRGRGGGPTDLIAAVRQAAGVAAAARVETAELSNAATIVATQRPFALVMSEDVYSFDAAEFRGASTRRQRDPDPRGHRERDAHEARAHLDAEARAGASQARSMTFLS